MLKRVNLSKEHWFLLTVLGATSFFDGYDSGIIGLALKQIRETYHLTESNASLLLAIVYLGALPALFITRAADRIGRRTLLTWSVFGYTIATIATALAPNAATFVGCQFVSRLFLNAEYAIVWALAAEELPADARGFGFGWLGMNQALGVGFAAIMFGGVFDPAGISWRWLYVVSVPTLAFVAVLRRRLPESRRFVEAKESGALAQRWHAIFEQPIRKWLFLVVATTFLVQLATQAAVFTIDFLQTERHLSASAANFMLVAAGLPGIPIMVLAGSLSDRLGRRVVGCGFAAMSVLGGAGFFWLPGGIPVLLPCMAMTIVGQLGALPSLGAYTTELFPTSLRGQAGSWATIASVCGMSGSLAIGGLLLRTFSQSATVLFLGVGPVIAIVLYAVFFPDTHGRELEDIHAAPTTPLPSELAALSVI